MRRATLWAVLIGVAILLPGMAAPASPPCQITMTPVQVRGALYLARLTVSPTCPPGRVFRVRKSSTLNVRRRGAPYQPIKPLLGAWEVSREKSTVPDEQLWSLITWRWETFDGVRWRAIPGAP